MAIKIEANGASRKQFNEEKECAEWIWIHPERINDQRCLKWSDKKTGADALNGSFSATFEVKDESKDLFTGRIDWWGENLDRPIYWRGGCWQRGNIQQKNYLFPDCSVCRSMLDGKLYCSSGQELVNRYVTTCGNNPLGCSLGIGGKQAYPVNSGGWINPYPDKNYTGIVDCLIEWTDNKDKATSNWGCVPTPTPTPTPATQTCPVPKDTAVNIPIGAPASSHTCDQNGIQYIGEGEEATLVFQEPIHTDIASFLQATQDRNSRISNNPLHQLPRIQPNTFKLLAGLQEIRIGTKALGRTLYKYYQLLTFDTGERKIDFVLEADAIHSVEPGFDGAPGSEVTPGPQEGWTWSVIGIVPQNWHRELGPEARLNEWVTSKLTNGFDAENAMWVLAATDFVLRLWPGADGVDRVVTDQTSGGKALGAIYATGDVLSFGVVTKLKAAKTLKLTCQAASVVSTSAFVGELSYKYSRGEFTKWDGVAGFFSVAGSAGQAVTLMRIVVRGGKAYLRGTNARLTAIKLAEWLRRDLHDTRSVGEIVDEITRNGIPPRALEAFKIRINPKTLFTDVSQHTLRTVEAWRAFLKNNAGKVIPLSDLTSEQLAEIFPTTSKDTIFAELIRKLGKVDLEIVDEVSSFSAHKEDILAKIELREGGELVVQVPTSIDMSDNHIEVVLHHELWDGLGLRKLVVAQRNGAPIFTDEAKRFFDKIIDADNQELLWESSYDTVADLIDRDSRLYASILVDWLRGTRKEFPEEVVKKLLAQNKLLFDNTDDLIQFTKDTILLEREMLRVYLFQYFREMRSYFEEGQFYARNAKSCDFSYLKSAEMDRKTSNSIQAILDENQEHIANFGSYIPPHLKYFVSSWRQHLEEFFKMY